MFLKKDIKMTDIFNQKCNNRHEERARKALSKLGLVEIPNVNRVTIKIGKQVFAFTNPSVAKLPSNDTFIVFGQPKVDDLMQRMQQLTAQNAFGGASNDFDPSAFQTADAGLPAAEAEEEADAEPEDEEGLDAAEIEMVI